MGAFGSRNFETRDSSTGAKLKSAYPRATEMIANATTLASGFGGQTIQLTPPLIPPVTLGGSPAIPLRRGDRWKFSADVFIQSDKTGSVSLESVSLVATLLDALGNALVQASTPARLGGLTALAQFQSAAIDEWLLDSSDLLDVTLPAAVTARPAGFIVQLFVNLNNSGGAAAALTVNARVVTALGEMQGYRFDKWE